MVRIDVKGLSDLTARLSKAPELLKKEVGAEIHFAGERFAELAVKSLRSQLFVDTKKSGFLMGSISADNSVPMQSSVVANKKYAAYVEWGTITRVSVPPELADYAIQFKGRGIKKTGGMYPRPFFFPQVPIVKAELVERINNILL